MKNQTPLLFNEFTALTAEQVFQKLHTSGQHGLSLPEVESRQKQHGLNTLPEQKNSWLRILLSQFASPFIYLLLLIVIITLALGDINSAVIIGACILLNTLVGFYQEAKAENSMHLLKKYLTSDVTVLRDDNEQEVASSALVPGDIVLFYPGDIIPADVRFIKQDHLHIDESALTGESGTVQKHANPIATPVTDIFKASNIGFSGTTIVSGKGVGVVIATGIHGSLGAIAALTAQAKRVSGFSLGLARFSRFILYIIIGTIALVFFTHLIIGTHNLSIINLALFAVALGVTIIPEGLPVVTTFGFTRGALQLLKHNVVVKRLSAIEDLGGVEVLCTDKTGTLTENKLAIAGTYGKEREALLWATLASGLSSRNLKVSKGFDAVLWHALTVPEQSSLNLYKKEHEIPFDPDRRRGLVVYEHDKNHYLVVRGAPDEVLRGCVPLADNQKTALDLWITQEGQRGNRVIAVALKELRQAISDEQLASYEKDMQLVGLIAFEDPLKKTARHAIEKARQLGVRIKILTGDSPEVCAAIASQVGLIQNPFQIISGEYFANQNYDEKKKLVEHGIGFARITPQQKFEIIQLLQENYRVGYMGDGINDGPALKIAHIALAVDDAADIARDAADIILLQRSLNVIINGIQEGRIIFANTLKYIKITLAAGFGHFYALAIASLLIDFLPMTPAQLLLLNLMSDIPLIALSTDTVSEDEIKAPQKYDIKAIILVATVFGLVITTCDFLFFGFFYRRSPAQLQTNWFIGCLLTELLFTFSARSMLPFYKAQAPSKTLMGLSLVMATIAIILPFTWFGQKWLLFTPPSGSDFAIIVALAITCFISVEGLKALYRFIYKKNPAL